MRDAETASSPHCGRRRIDLATSTVVVTVASPSTVTTPIPLAIAAATVAASGQPVPGSLLPCAPASPRCSNATILEQLLPLPTGGLAVLAFVQTEALLWHLDRRQAIVRWSSRGHRHPKDALLVSDPPSSHAHADARAQQPSTVVLAYAIRSTIHVHSTERAVHEHHTAVTPPTLDHESESARPTPNPDPDPDRDAASSTVTPSPMLSLEPTLGRSFSHNFHGREALCAVALPPLRAEWLVQQSQLTHPQRLASWLSCSLFATGSEDNTIKIVSHRHHHDHAPHTAQLDSASASRDALGAAHETLEVEATLEAHPAAVRALALSHDPRRLSAAPCRNEPRLDHLHRQPSTSLSSDVVARSHILFSAGGKEAIYAWRLTEPLAGGDHHPPPPAPVPPHPTLPSHPDGHAHRHSRLAHPSCDISDLAHLSSAWRASQVCRHVRPERNSRAAKRGGDGQARMHLEHAPRACSARMQLLSTFPPSLTRPRTSSSHRCAHSSRLTRDT